MRALQQNPRSHKSYMVDKRQLRRKGRVVVGHDPTLHNQILLLYHSFGIGGHSGVHATYQKIAVILY